MSIADIVDIEHILGKDDIVDREDIIDIDDISGIRNTPPPSEWIRVSGTPRNLVSEGGVGVFLAPQSLCLSANYGQESR